MSGNGSSRSRLALLRGLAVFAVVVAGLGMAFVVVRQATRGTGEQAVAAPQTPQPAAATPASSPATGAAATRSATASGKAPVVATPRKTTDAATAVTRNPGPVVSRVQPGQNQTSAERRVASTAKTATRKTPVYEPHRWDEGTGEIVVGKRRFLRKAAAVRKLELAEEQKTAVAKFEETFRFNVDQQLAQLETNLESNVNAYQRAEKDKDVDGVAHYVDEHAELSEQRDAMLDALDQQYEDGLKDILPEDQVEKL
ncbi:MAG: hypothetical protein JXL80_13825 [Planctomycetes bacterium]|nr:hypothetical protein [Planctomycetota bacterium]